MTERCVCGGGGYTSNTSILFFTIVCIPLFETKSAWDSVSTKNCCTQYTRTLFCITCRCMAVEIESQVPMRGFCSTWLEKVSFKILHVSKSLNNQNITGAYRQVKVNYCFEH